VRLSGPDCVPFLQSQCSADLRALRPGAGCDAVLLTPTARCVDLATVLALDSSLLLLLSPRAAGDVTARLEKHIFPADKVAVADVTAATGAFALAGPGVADALERLGAGAMASAPRGAHALFGFSGQPVVVVSGCGLASPGATLVADESVAGALWAALTGTLGAVPAGEDAWERLRIAEGRPARGAELSDDANPLEAALYATVSLSKGCYMGQETLARLHARDGPKQQLWGVRLPPGTPVAAGDAVMLLADADGAATAAPGGVVGTITSACAEDGTALAFIKCRPGGVALRAEGARVRVAGADGVLCDTPCASRTLPTGAEPAPEAAAAAAMPDGDAEAARKAKKLADMATRVAAYEAAQRAAKAAQ
jgi:hypothetical protein